MTIICIDPAIQDYLRILADFLEKSPLMDSPDTAQRIKRIKERTMSISEAIRPGLLNDVDYAGYVLAYSLTNEYAEKVQPNLSNIHGERTVCI